ncbi:MAG: molecular chaperone TorD family protein [Nitrospirae bacterium]|nr:molecular chaperone TorD family protein [Nitrospirota bacterium]
MELNDSENIERAAIYRLFSSLFMNEPDDETLVRIREIFGMEFEDAPEEIRADYAATFLKPDHPPSPYESLYHYSFGDTPRLWGKATAEVQTFYRSAGLMVGEEPDIVPDHLGLELLFMSYLIERGLFRQQREFLDLHLMRWVPEYCDEVRRHAATTFYRELAEIMKEFIASDYESLKEAL